VVLVDASPEFRLQAIKLGLSHFDALLLTHSHHARLLGLSALVNGRREAGRPLLVFAPPMVVEDSRERASYLWTEKNYRRTVQLRAIEGSLELQELQVTPIRVDHGTEGVAFGYLMELRGRRLAYIPTMLRVTSEVRQALSGLDLLVLGASHYYDDTEMWKRSVMDVVSASELIHELVPDQAILTYLSHTVEYDGASARLAPEIRLAYDGLIVEIPE
jgi:phosphoribosyl 1,2-cyclic phosphate phosphodiesterase